MAWSDTQANAKAAARSFRTRGLPFHLWPGSLTNAELRPRISEINDRWREEASEAALEGDPARAGYIEHMCGRLRDPRLGALKREEDRS